MSNKPWLYIINPFQRATRNSYLRASIIGTFTDAALHANPALATLYAYFHPLCENYNHLYALWRMQAGTQKGKTLDITQLLAQATEHINDWEYQVMGTYKKTSPAFMAIFPNGHAPYQQGSQQSRMAAFEALKMALEGAGLDEIAAGVADYHASMVAALEAQKGAIGQTSQKSSDLEAARIALCKGLYYVLGELMKHYVDNPDSIASYFKLELIQNRQQKSFTGHLAGGALFLIARRTLEANEEVSLLNGGTDNLIFFLTDNPHLTHYTSGGITLPAGTSREVTASQLGNAPAAHYLMVYNPANTEGVWEVDL